MGKKLQEHSRDKRNDASPWLFCVTKTDNNKNAQDNKKEAISSA